jgi:hypothetical protein
MRAGIMYDWYIDGEGKRCLGVVASRNILPVLWHGERELLDLNDLPPPFVRSIKYDLQLGILSSRVAATYRRDGMLGIVRRRAKGTYWPIVEHLAREIILRAKSPPPPLSSKPLLDAIPNAFWDPPPPGAQVPPDAGEWLAAALPGAGVPAAPRVSGPTQIVALYVRDQSAQIQTWGGYSDDVPLADQVDDTLRGRGLSIRHTPLSIASPRFRDDALSLLLDATREQATPILFIDSAVLNRAAYRELLRALALDPWIGGIIIPGRGSEVVAGFLSQDLALPLERSEQVVVRTEIATAAAFEVAVVSVVQDILARISRFGSVQNIPQANRGPTSRPRLSNT